ncbi:MAG: hypothetical protein DWQ31_16490 [Planctomycetota bacterium]|nr:MAG: hypothetical protein DWQ31_16490 [Planctomycetota bacterium]REJ92845.1 MAG: hypothetical protein DWQ35_11410 [Planctomycetota bacterium]REK24626.1 MAG: hypothetical protein DWQ42_13380 [Planctomycetota bacterium]REK38352.1 MAG: hypothetical protein DWQ46_20725 [Planctomycetota bacterium]
MQEELAEISSEISGYTVSLSNPKLSPTVRSVLEQSLEKAVKRQQAIEQTLAESESLRDAVETVLDPETVVQRLSRLDEVLAANNPSMGNIELSLHIDRIDCYPDRRVVLRTCKLGALAGAVEMLSVHEDSQPHDKPVKPRRRARLRVDDGNDEEWEATAEWSADPNRFAGLGEHWFDETEYVIPDRPLPWAVENAEAVFRRRQKAKLSYVKLAREFNVSPPTARAAVQHYLSEHPDETDDVNLPQGGQRPPKFDLSKFGHEARALWDAGTSKLQLAKKYECSTPTIDKAIAWSYEQEGLPMPTRQNRKEAKFRQARRMLDEGHPLDDITRELGVSDVTARSYLRESFAKEGKPMPDLRRRRET